jgi:hypothetical protein
MLGWNVTGSHIQGTVVIRWTTHSTFRRRNKGTFSEDWSQINADRRIRNGFGNGIPYTIYGIGHGLEQIFDFWIISWRRHGIPFFLLEKHWKYMPTTVGHRIQMLIRQTVARNFPIFWRAGYVSALIAIPKPLPGQCDPKKAGWKPTPHSGAGFQPADSTAHELTA